MNCSYLSSVSQNLVQGLEKSISPGNLLEMQNLRPLLRELNQNKFLTILLDVVSPLKFEKHPKDYTLRNAAVLENNLMPFIVPAMCFISSSTPFLPLATIT